MMSKIKKTHVIGAGAMGHGIAQVFAQSGCDVVISDVNEEILERAKGHIETNLRFLVQYGLVEESEISEILSRTTTVLSTNDTTYDADLIIEAVPEDLDLKQKVLGEAEKASSSDTILATTTSVIQVTDIGT
ncbi:MAG: 3-hydroxyacyl-CoA dehydrogenase family protein, partial [Candidatus Thorarchaeota archaeon]